MDARAHLSGGVAERAGPFVVFLIGAAVIWLPPRPPMIDLPEFAGEIALLKGLITGATPWAANLRIDALTPYLLGYAVTLPLAFVLPIVASLKVVLTAALAAFGLASAAIRRELGATRALDAYALIGFFGYDYSWGLYTFLVAAPLGLVVIWLSLRYARAPGVGRGLALLAAGGALLFAHGLVFLLAVGIGALVTVVSSGGPRRAVARPWLFAIPFVIAALIAALIYAHSRGESGIGSGLGLDFGPLGLRLMGPLFGIDGRPGRATAAFLVLLALLPFIGGLRFQIRPLSRTIIAGGVIGTLAFAPAVFWLAAGLYLRFALFLPPAWAWMFSDAESSPKGLAGAIRPRLAVSASALAGLILAQHGVQAARFARETADFDAVMAAARPGQRALGLVLDKGSAANVDPQIYWHFPSWYQAEKGGLVDPSFAVGPPSIVRYRQNPPGAPADGAFDWRRDQGGQWTYFFVRDRRPIPTALFAGAPCRPVRVAARGAWTLFEARPCAEPAK